MRNYKLACLLVAAILAVSGCSSNSAESAKAAPDAATAPPAASAASSPSSPAMSPARPAASESAAKPDKPVAPAPPAPPRLISVPAGTALNVVLIDALSSEKNKAGDTFTASMAEPVVVDGKTVIAKGVKVHGKVMDAEGSGKVKGLASMRLVLTGVVDGAKVIPIVTRPFVVQAESTKGRDAAVAGGGAGVGAAIGAIAGGKKGAGIGALIGGAAGTGAVLATKGKEVEFASETRLKFTLDKTTELPSIGR